MVRHFSVGHPFNPKHMQFFFTLTTYTCYEEDEQTAQMINELQSFLWTVPERERERESREASETFLLHHFLVTETAALSGAQRRTLT